MNKVNNFLNEIPSWLVTMIIAITVSYVTIQLKVNTLEVNYTTIKEQIQTVKNDKAAMKEITPKPEDFGNVPNKTPEGSPSEN